jgi:hypothetical protein
MKRRLVVSVVALALLAPGTSAEERRTPAEVPTPRADRNSMVAHEQLLRKAKQGGIDLYFLGDSITRRGGPAYTANGIIPVRRLTSRRTQPIST